MTQEEWKEFRAELEGVFNKRKSELVTLSIVLDKKDGNVCVGGSAKYAEILAMLTTIMRFDDKIHQLFKDAFNTLSAIDTKEYNKSEIFS